jgi:hypothetical protein
LSALRDGDPRGVAGPALRAGRSRCQRWLLPFGGGFGSSSERPAGARGGPASTGIALGVDLGLPRTERRPPSPFEGHGDAVGGDTDQAGGGQFRTLIAFNSRFWVSRRIGRGTPPSNDTVVDMDFPLWMEVANAGVAAEAGRVVAGRVRVDPAVVWL